MAGAAVRESLGSFYGKQAGIWDRAQNFFAGGLRSVGAGIGAAAGQLAKPTASFMDRHGWTQGARAATDHFTNSLTESALSSQAQSLQGLMGVSPRVATMAVGNAYGRYANPPQPWDTRQQVLAQQSADLDKVNINGQNNLFGATPRTLSGVSRVLQHTADDAAAAIPTLGASALLPSGATGSVARGVGGTQAGWTPFQLLGQTIAEGGNIGEAMRKMPDYQAGAFPDVSPDAMATYNSYSQLTGAPAPRTGEDAARIQAGADSVGNARAAEFAQVGQPPVTANGTGTVLKSLANTATAAAVGTPVDIGKLKEIPDKIRDSVAALATQSPQEYQALAAKATGTVKSLLAAPGVTGAVKAIAETGQAPPPVTNGAANGLARQGFQLSDAWEAVKGMEPWQQLLLATGVSLGGIGLFQALAGEGGLGSWLMALLGFGAAAGVAAGGGAFGPDAQNFVQSFLPGGSQTPPGIAPPATNPATAASPLSQSAPAQPAPGGMPQVMMQQMVRLPDGPLLAAMQSPAARQMLPADLVQSLDQGAAALRQGGISAWTATHMAGQRATQYGLKPEDGQRLLQLWSQATAPAVAPSAAG